MAWLLSLALAVPMSIVTAGVEPMRSPDWFSIDLYHLSRTLPDLDRVLELPVNPRFGRVYGHSGTGFGFSASGT